MWSIKLPLHHTNTDPLIYCFYIKLIMHGSRVKVFCSAGTYLIRSRHRSNRKHNSRKNVRMKCTSISHLGFESFFWLPFEKLFWMPVWIFTFSGCQENIVRIIRQLKFQKVPNPCKGFYRYNWCRLAELVGYGSIKVVVDNWYSEKVIWNMVDHCNHWIKS